MKIKLLTDTATMPTRGSEKAAGWDLYADFADEIYLPPNDVRMIGTGVAVEIPEGYFGALFARSGIASKRGLRPANCVGVIDSDYRGEIKVAIINDSTYVQKIEPQERIAQLVILPYKSVELEQVDELDKTERGEGEFGNNGTN